MSAIINLKRELRLNNINGIAVDIDETLSFTLKYWFDRMRVKFGNPEKLSTEELIKKYRYAQHVPYWQTENAQKWMIAQVYSNAVQTKLEIIGEADKYLPLAHKIKPVVAYLTVRPEEVTKGTATWLAKHNFPAAAIIARPSHINHKDGNKWKAEVLNELFPEVCGLIDDNDQILQYLSEQYQGELFFYSRETCLDSNLKTHCCPKWTDIIKQLKNIYS